MTTAVGVSTGYQFLRYPGFSLLPEYGIWRTMKARCQNPKLRQFTNYGGRGITVCERWQKFDSFYADMGPRPSPLHSIDRRDNDGNYEPLNCRWATRAQQAATRSTTKLNWVAVGLIRHMTRRGASLRQLAHAFGIGHQTVVYTIRHRVCATPNE